MHKETTNPVLSALDRNQSDVLRALLAAGANPNLPDRMKRTALMYAALAGKDESLALLLEYKADPNVEDQNGQTALHLAAQDYRPAAAAMLLDAGARVDATDTYGNTPLFKAVFRSRGRGELITLLLAHGADPRRKNKADISPLDLAKTIANCDTLQFFPEHARS